MNTKVIDLSINSIVSKSPIVTINMPPKTADFFNKRKFQYQKSSSLKELLNEPVEKLNSKPALKNIFIKSKPVSPL